MFPYKYPKLLSTIVVATMSILHLISIHKVVLTPPDNALTKTSISSSSFWTSYYLSSNPSSSESPRSLSLSLGLSSSYQVDSFVNGKSYRKVSPIIKTNGSLPHLVIHLGPPKTETTTIQSYLTRWQVDSLLEKDQYIYLGKYIYADDTALPEKINNERRRHTPLIRQLTNFECHIKMNSVREEYENDSKSSQRNISLSKIILSKLQCAKDLVKSITKYSNSKTNLLYFDETLSNRNSYNATNPFNGYRYYYGNNSYPTIFDWVSLHSILKDFYQITVFVTYRRYYEWLPSAKYQVERYQGHETRLEQWPNFGESPIQSTEKLMTDFMLKTHKTARYLKKTLQQNLELNTSGRMIEPLFPNWWKDNFPPGSTTASRQYYTDSVLRGIDQLNHRSIPTKSKASSPIIRLILLNMHKSVSSSMARSDSRQGTTISYTNLRSVFVCSLPAAPKLCNYSRKLEGKEERVGTVVHKNSGGTHWYDELVINAARYGFINITRYPISRQAIIELAEEYHQSLLSSLATQNKSMLVSEETYTGPARSKYEFPLVCPPADQLTEFVTQSLQYEQIILPDFYEINQHDHISQFWDRVRDKHKNYCVIDPIKTLRRRHWQKFFLSLLPSKLKNKVIHGSIQK